MLASLLETRHAPWALLVLRVVFGAAFIVHGYGKVLDPATHDQLVGMLAGLQVPAPELFAWLVGLTEFVGGLLLVVGLLTRLAALAALVNMAVAMALVHWGNGFLVTNQPPGWELNLLYMGAFATLLIAGAGHLSIDEALARALRRREPVTTTRARTPVADTRRPVTGT